MNEHGRDDHEQLYPESYPGRYPDVLTDQALGERISHFFQEQAQHVEFTPQLREHFLHKIPAHRERSFRPLFVVALASAAMLILALTFNVYLSQLIQPTTSQEVRYTASQKLSVASELAHGGQLVSVDPTNQRVVYQPAQQSGIFYTAHLSNPIASNTLAMRDAHDMAWAPDGSALVATVSSEGTALPLLALVPDGQYMHLLGHDALAATWSSTDPQQISYVIPDHGHTQLWSTSRDGKSTKLVSTMPLSLLVKHMLWSPDGHYLALTVVSGTTLTQATLSQPASALYLVDMQSNTMQTFTAPKGSSIANPEWSPNGKNLAYEQVDGAGKSILQAVNLTKPADHFSITPQRQLLGWSWSPDGRAIVYSDGGTLRTHILHGQAVIFSQSSSQIVSPFWLKNGTILCVQVNQGANTLELLKPEKK